MVTVLVVYRVLLVRVPLFPLNQFSLSVYLLMIKIIINLNRCKIRSFKLLAQGDRTSVRSMLFVTKCFNHTINVFIHVLSGVYQLIEILQKFDDIHCGGKNIPLIMILHCL